MHVFEVKRNQSISFGDFEDLKLVNESRLFGGSSLLRTFYPGNFSLSLSHGNGAGSNPTIIIHQENVDPNLILQKLRDASEGKANLVYLLEPPSSMGKRKKNVLEPVDWFAVHEMSPADLPVNRHSTAIVHDFCSFCEESSVKIDHCQTSFAEANVSHQLFEVHKEFGAGLAEEKAISYLGLFYFVTDTSWTKVNSKIDFKISLLDHHAPVYQLELEGKCIGFAINPTALMMQEKRRGILFEDVTRECFALVIQDAEKQPAINGQSNFIIPIENFLFANGGRGYYRFDVFPENALIGGSNSSQFDFSRLPSNVFKNILLLLPWKEQMLCRRVNKRWMSVGNAVIAETTKVIDTESKPFKYFTHADFEVLLPIVADGLETLKLFFGELNLGCITSIPSFRSLREIDFGGIPVNYDHFFLLMNKCPNLKKLRAQVPWKRPDPDVPVKAYNSVEHLHLMANVTDPSLMAIADHFPNLFRLRIPYPCHVTKSGFSALVERYGSKLSELEISQPDVTDYMPRMGAFTGIGTCTNLTYLSLARMDLISNSFMVALANGCINLITLDIAESKYVTNFGLSVLASLPMLKNLDVSYSAAADVGFSEGITAIASKGGLQQLLALGCFLSADCLKTCVRKCTDLMLLDIRDNFDLTVDDAEEIASLFGQNGQSPVLYIRSRRLIWFDNRVLTIQTAIRDGGFPHRGRLVMDGRIGEIGFIHAGKVMDEGDDLVLGDPTLVELFIGSDDEDSEGEESD